MLAVDEWGRPHWHLVSVDVTAKFPSELGVDRAGGVRFRFERKKRTLTLEMSGRRQHAQHRCLRPQRCTSLSPPPSSHALSSPVPLTPSFLPLALLLSPQNMLRKTTSPRSTRICRPDKRECVGFDRAASSVSRSPTRGRRHLERHDWLTWNTAQISVGYSREATSR